VSTPADSGIDAQLIVTSHQSPSLRCSRSSSNTSRRPVGSVASVSTSISLRERTVASYDGASGSSWNSSRSSWRRSPGSSSLSVM
jgi:hypothetical protein